jgi:hypothetical protein
MRIIVRKQGGPFLLNDTFMVDTAELGDEWYNFLLATNFWKVPPYMTVYNETRRVGFNRFVYTVETGGRKIVYNENFYVGSPDFLYIKDFVDYVLGKYKYNIIRF